MTVAAAAEELNVYFERLYREHEQAVRGFALSLLRNPAEADDLTQNAFLGAYRALLQGALPREPRAWLLAITKNLACRQFRERTRAQRTLVALEVPTPPEASSAPSAAEIRLALERLRPREREALLLRELHGLSYAELKERLGLEPRALQVLLFRARTMLQELLEADGSSLSCGEVAQIVDLQLSCNASAAERRSLRAHLRSCQDCATIARSRRARASRVGTLSALPLPWGIFQRLASLFGDGSVSSSVVVKATLVLGGTAVASSVAVTIDRGGFSSHRPAATAAQAPASAFRAADETQAQSRPRIAVQTLLASRAALRRVSAKDSTLVPGHVQHGALGAHTVVAPVSLTPLAAALALPDPFAAAPPTPAPSPLTSAPASAPSAGGAEASSAATEAEAASTSSEAAPDTTLSAPASTPSPATTTVAVPAATTAPTPTTAPSSSKPAPGHAGENARKSGSDPSAGGKSTQDLPVPNGRPAAGQAHAEGPPGNGKPVDPGNATANASAPGRGGHTQDGAPGSQPAAGATAADAVDTSPSATEAAASVPPETTAESASEPATTTSTTTATTETESASEAATTTSTTTATTETAPAPAPETDAPQPLEP